MASITHPARLPFEMVSGCPPVDLGFDPKAIIPTYFACCSTPYLTSATGALQLNFPMSLDMIQIYPCIPTARRTVESTSPPATGFSREIKAIPGATGSIIYITQPEMPLKKVQLDIALKPVERVAGEGLKCEDPLLRLTFKLDTPCFPVAITNVIKMAGGTATTGGLRKVTGTCVLKFTLNLPTGSGGGGLGIRGTPALYMVVAAREYDESGNLVPVGMESWPSLAAGHELYPTWDWVRAHINE